MKNKIVLAVFSIIILPVIITDITQIRSWKNVINADGYGYYAYLPCVFMQHDFDFSKIQAKEIKLRGNISPEEVGYPFVSVPWDKNKVMDKYYAGTALALTPFFLLAYFLSYLFGFDTGGYSILFQESVAIAAVLYLLVGLIYIRKILQEYKIVDPIIFFSLASILYGTNLFYYTVSEPSLSHVYSFSFCSIFLYFSYKSFQEFRLKHLLLATAAFSILFIIRPTNVLMLLFVPFFASGSAQLKTFLQTALSLKRIAFFTIIALLITSVQLLLWYFETGKAFVWGYGGESFNFSSPHIIEFLFSYRKGVFVYAPILFVILLITIFIFFKNKNYYQILVLTIFLTTIIYVCSSWHQWWYGGSFGMRPFIDFYPVFALLLGVSLSSLTLKWRVASFIISSLLIGLAIVQTIQYRKFIISADKMNKVRYWHIFLKTDDKYGWVYDNPSSGYNFFKSPVFSSDNAKTGNDSLILKEFLPSTDKSLMLNKDKTLLASFDGVSLPQLNNICIDFKSWVYMARIDYHPNIFIEVVDEKNKSVIQFEKALADELGDPKEWDKVEFITPLPTLTPDSKILLYTLSGNDSILIKNTEIRFGLAK